MTVRALLLLTLLPALSACQDTRARAQTAALSQRVAALEAQVRGLKAAQSQDAPPAGFEAKVSAQNCANDLARALEIHREHSIDQRYPEAAQLNLPDTCTGQRVNWVTLSARAFTFTVTGGNGQELARQSGGS